MSIVTLITDFGFRDYYTAMLKGNLITALQPKYIVDVSHDVTPHDILEAGFLLKKTFPGFPKGTIHVVYVKNHEREQNLIFAECEGHFFIGPNNGLFSLVFPETMPTFYGLRKNPFMPFKEVGEVAGQIKQGKALSEIGELENDVRKLLVLQPIVTPDQIRGSVIHIDRYGNLLLNIGHELFERVRNGRRFRIYFKRFEPIEKISSYYSDAEVGEPICLFNSFGDMVLSVSMGNAYDELGLKKEETVQILFG